MDNRESISNSLKELGIKDPTEGQIDEWAVSEAIGAMNMKITFCLSHMISDIGKLPTERLTKYFKGFEKRLLDLDQTWWK